MKSERNGPINTLIGVLLFAERPPGVAVTCSSLEGAARGRSAGSRDDGGGAFRVQMFLRSAAVRPSLQLRPLDSRASAALRSSAGDRKHHEARVVFWVYFFFFKQDGIGELKATNTGSDFRRPSFSSFFCLLFSFLKNRKRSSCLCFFSFSSRNLSTLKLFIHLLTSFFFKVR